MAALTLYHYDASPPSRLALITCKALDLDVDIKIIDLFASEQLSPDFVKINPQHCVPTLVDGDFVLWESKAVACYLVNEHGKDDKLYPKDNKLRAIVDQRLHYDSSTLLPALKACFYPIAFLGAKEIDPENKKTFNNALAFLESILEEDDYMAGKWITIADFAIITTLSSAFACFDWDMTEYPKVSKWVERCSLEIPDFSEINEKGTQMYANFVKSKLNSE